MSSNFKTFFVVNPSAGGGRARKVWQRMHKMLAHEFGESDFAYTDSQGHGIVLTSEALRAGYEMVVAVGGDGTVNEVVNGFYEDGEILADDPILGILPAGTGGDYVRSLGFSKTYRDRIARLRGKKTRQVDLGRVFYQSLDGMQLERYYANIAGCGLPGELVDEIRKVSRRLGGTAAYLTGLVRALRRHENHDLTLTMDDREPLEKKALCAVIANGQYFGSGMHVAPDAILDDGWLDVIVIGDVQIRDLLSHLPQLYWGNIRNHPKVEVYRAKKIKIASDYPVLLDMDGEQQGVLPATYEILPKALRLKI